MHHNYDVELIPEGVSREKIKQEVDRFMSMDKNAFEYNKINTYLDEVFSIPWKQYTVSRSIWL